MNKSFTLIDIMKEIFLYKKSLFAITFTCILTSFIFYNHLNKQQNYDIYLDINYDYSGQSIPNKDLTELSKYFFASFKDEKSDHKLKFVHENGESFILIEALSTLKLDTTNELISELNNKIAAYKLEFLNYQYLLKSVIKAEPLLFNSSKISEEFFQISKMINVVEDTSYSFSLSDKKTIGIKLPIFFVLTVGLLTGLILSFVILYFYIFVVMSKNLLSKSK